MQKFCKSSGLYNGVVFKFLSDSSVTVQDRLIIIAVCFCLKEYILEGADWLMCE